MTVIAAVATDDRVVMACDTAANNDGTAVYKAEGKIAKLRTKQGATVLLAAAGNASLLPALLRRLEINETPGLGADNVEADSWAGGIAEAITTALAEANPSLLVAADTDSAAYLDGTLLMAWHRHLWIVHTHGVIRPYSGIAAIGSGTDVALGCLHTARSVDLAPEAAVSMAVHLACAYADGCRVDERGPLVHATA